MHHNVILHNVRIVCSFEDAVKTVVADLEKTPAERRKARAERCKSKKGVST